MTTKTYPLTHGWQVTLVGDKEEQTLVFECPHRGEEITLNRESTTKLKEIFKKL